MEVPPLPALKGLLLLSGIYDLSGIPDSFLRDEARMTHAEAEAWSPLGAAQLDCPLRIIALGMDETLPFHAQALALKAMLQSENQPVSILNVPHRNHMSVVLDLGDPDSALGRSLSYMVSAS